MKEMCNCKVPEGLDFCNKCKLVILPVCLGGQNKRRIPLDKKSWENIVGSTGKN